MHTWWFHIQLCSLYSEDPVYGTLYQQNFCMNWDRSWWYQKHPITYRSCIWGNGIFRCYRILILITLLCIQDTKNCKNSFSLIESVLQYWCRTFTISRMPVFFKQRDNYFFPAWAFVIPTTILRLPISLVESLLWSIHHVSHSLSDECMT